MSFIHKLPRELQNEDRWFKFFLPNQAIAAGVCAVIAIALGTATIRFGIVPTAVIEIFYVLTCAFFIFFKIPPNNYLLGGGQYLIIVLLRCLVRIFSRTIYVKHYVDEEDSYE